MHMLRTYADSEGTSHWDQVDLGFVAADFAPPAPPVELAAGQPATRVVFVRLPVGWEDRLHPSPARQIWVGISGILRVTTTDGETRDIPPGTPWLMEDVTGDGHGTIALGVAPATEVITQLPPHSDG